MNFLPFLFISAFYFLQCPAFAAQKSYVVYLGAQSDFAAEFSADANEIVTQSHFELLESFLQSKEKARDAIFYSYTRCINGFAAILEEEDALEISKHPGVVSVFENRGHKLHTTRSWQFLGLERDGIVPKQSLWTKARFGEDVIIANLDGGVWPESKSFRDDDMGPIPSKWKGICQNGSKHEFSCNRKLIGARYFNKGYLAAGGVVNSTLNSPRDQDGHGTHTLSIAGGSFVPNASFLGFGNGTAKGGSPRARVVGYKVCWPPINGSQCFSADILAGFEAAIKDGVDVISVSFGSMAVNYFRDAIAIGSFHAVNNGIAVVTSAGNLGPVPAFVSNVAPWLFTVGASTIDREFPSYVVLDQKRQFMGQSFSSESLAKNKLYPLIRSIDAANADASSDDADKCLPGSLDKKKAKGKILVCTRGANVRLEKGEVVKLAGGLGMILVNDNFTADEIIADPHFLPATHITYSDGLKLLSYIKSTKSPKASITHPVTKLGTKPAPFMAAFSSQGPNTINPEILKPDITAPGVSIIAAYSEGTSPSGLDFDKRRFPFNLESGTSMACPHVAGIVGLLKSLHPNWSPAAIKSAIMTTAKARDNLLEPIKNGTLAKANPFNYGSGHVRPNRAMNPGLVYDLSVTDYLNFLCALGYSSTQISTFKKYNCPSKARALVDLNYPSITIPELSDSITVARKLKNVGTPGTYVARVRSPNGVMIKVAPTSLTFKEAGEEKTFKLTLAPIGDFVAKDYVFGLLEWSDGNKHRVRSPITIKSKGF
ncbi:subtilisin-like protease SBT5.3 [Phalaenopsis equestris]|uniref:subtilisin-like protease SBT5.3 n=1 Tax=Phalaenopsis equestris TaxID=78828 RepID=UPI0009E2F974|nr:subtilisin-like protease SBT5.3 [Phalaenopsis equestris]